MFLALLKIQKTEIFLLIMYPFQGLSFDLGSNRAGRVSWSELAATTCLSVNLEVC